MIPEPRFRIAFQVHHPSLPAKDIVDKLRYRTRYEHSVGMERTTKSGQKLPGIYKETAISFILHEEVLTAFDTIPQLLMDFLENVDEPHVKRILSTDGVCSLLFGIYSDTNVFFELPPEVINYLSRLEIGIKLDFYGGD